MELTWNPDFPTRAVVYSEDNAIRIVNPITGRILKSAMVNPPKPPLSSLVYIPQHGRLAIYSKIVLIFLIRLSDDVSVYLTCSRNYLCSKNIGRRVKLFRNADI